MWEVWGVPKVKDQEQTKQKEQWEPQRRDQIVHRGTKDS